MTNQELSSLGTIPNVGIEPKMSDWEENHPFLSYILDELITMLFLLSPFLLLAAGLLATAYFPAVAPITGTICFLVFLTLL